MKIIEMFEKDIKRPIQGVVKIGQDSEEIIKTELEEYIVTKELNRYFAKFFEAYRKGTQNRTDKMGVWISGFFGSGKSHMLKILSYLLTSKTYGGKRAIDYFEGKITDRSVMADMQAAANVNADVILFNIGAEAEANSKANKEPIVMVFMKMFNKMQGYCATMPWIAELERQMSKDGSYDPFRASFRVISGLSWEEAREDFYYERDNIIKALAASTKMSTEAALNWYNKAEDNYTLDINTFARRVREYIEAKEKQTGKKRFVVFLGDEVGQYIGSQGELMLSLQNVVEGLGTECGGRAWVIATGQEDIDSIIGNIPKTDRDTFSKIIGRFDTRFTLSSANVDEVIKKRLLLKKEQANQRLRLLYSEKGSLIKNLITFSHDNTPQKRLYSGPEDFADVYPFIPYQFDLLQKVFNGIRTHGATGKHISEGERSLLDAIQGAAKQYASFEDGILSPFDSFYPAVEVSLDHNISKVILDAEDSAERNDGALLPYDIEVFKVLFMVKYIPEILPANLENITTLMLQNIDQDKTEAQKKIDASLRRLEVQKLILKNGDQYIFLTNDEQDVNREIRDIHIDHSEIIDKVGGNIFSSLFGLNKKYHYSDRYDFAFNTMIDDRPIGSQKEEIAIKVLTPMFAHGTTDMELQTKSVRSVIVVLSPNDYSYINEMEQSLQIETYLRRNSGKTSTKAVEDIKNTKTREVRERADRSHKLINEALRTAIIYVNGSRMDIKEKEPGQRITEAFQALVEGLYSKLNYITHPYLSTENLREILAHKNVQEVLAGMEPKEPNHLAIMEMADIIRTKANLNQPVTMRSLMELFVKIPYGWKEMDIAGILLTLFKKQEVRLEMSGQAIAPNDTRLLDYVLKREYLDRLVIKMRLKIASELLDNARIIARDVFGRTDVPSDEDGLMARIKEFAAAELIGRDDSILKLMIEYGKAPYPGQDVLEDGKKLLEQFESLKDIKAFFEYLKEQKEALVKYEACVQDVKSFFKTEQRKAFDDALRMLKIYEGNRSYVLDPETVSIVTDIEGITRMATPYSDIYRLNDLVMKFRQRFGDILEDECKPVRIDIQADKAAVMNDLSRRPFAGQFSARVNDEFDELLDRLSHVNNIYEAIAMRTESDRKKQRLIQQFADEEARLAAIQGNSSGDTKPVPVPITKTISVKTLFSGTKQIASRHDIDLLLSELRIKLEEQLQDGSTIHIV